MRRVTFTLPDDLVKSLDLIASSMKVSRSSLVSLLLSEKLELLVELSSPFSDVDNPESLKRAKGESVELIKSRFEELQSEFEMYQKD